MENAIVITPRVIERLCNMTPDERHLMLDTLCCDEILHIDRRTTLSPMDEMAYHIFRMNVMNDSRRHAAISADSTSLRAM